MQRHTIARRCIAAGDGRAGEAQEINREGHTRGKIVRVVAP